MGKLLRRTLLSAAVLAAGVMAQESTVGGPISGLLVDEQARSIRPILGMPGSAHAGEATVTEFDFARIAPSGREALVARGGVLHLIRRLDGAEPVWRELSRDAATITNAAWSEDSAALGVVNRTTNRLEFWTSLSGDPEAAAPADISGLGERIVSVAVDGAAGYGFVATQGESGGGLYLVKAGEQPRLILGLERAGALLLSGETLYVADRGRNEVLRIVKWATNAEVATVAASGQGVSDPVGAVLSQDRKTLYIASAGAKQVMAVELSTSAVTATVDLDFQPTRLERMGGGNLLLLESGVAGSAPAQVMDAGTRRVSFIPVSAGAGE